jgi:hypothetical protein
MFKLNDMVNTGRAQSAGNEKVETPVYFRLPKPGESDPFFGANRSFWCEQILPTPRNGYKARVESVTFRNPGQSKGSRFILFESALVFFNQHLNQVSIPGQKEVS